MLRVYALALLLALVPQFALAKESRPSSASSAALREMTRSNWTAARGMVQRTGDPILATMYEWLLYREKFTGLPFDTIAAFLRNHPQWPDRNAILASAERNMPSTYPRDSVLIWFREYPPVTGIGLKRYLDALSAAGQQSTVKPILQDRWPVVGIKPDEQAEILRVYGSLILPDTQRRRLDKLLFQGDDSTARALAASLGQDYLKLVEARIALAGEKSDAPRLLNQVPARFARDPGLLYERLRWRRRSGHTEGAIEILNAQPPMRSISNPEGWWKERNILARTLIEEKNYKAAYKLAAAHDQIEGSDYADAEWLCGWLALRFLNNPARAAEHFVSMYEGVKTSISKARGAYWAARAAEAMGQAEQSSNWYKIAAQHPKVYYGQLAALKLPSALRIYRPLNVTATSADRARMKEDELVNGIRLAHAAGLDKMRRQLIKAKIETLETPSEYKAFSEILSGLGLRNEAVRVAKKAAGHNIFLDIEAYPELSRYFSNLDVDEALAHAVIRQESEFDQYAQSPSGAMGLMQLMPSTASYVAKKRGWEHQTSWLTSRPEHNILLGSAYLNNLLNTYNGSYPLVLAAYNAGGSRVNRWLKENGDPRAGQVDWVDWIELIPIYETRNYVQRVMESYVVYNEYMGMRKSR